MGNGVIRALHQGRGAVRHYKVRRDRAAGISLVWNRGDRDGAVGDAFLADLYRDGVGRRRVVAVGAVALDLVVHGVVPGVLALGDVIAPRVVVQAVLHVAAGGGARIDQLLLGAFILQAGLGGGGSTNAGGGEAAGHIKGLGQDELAASAAAILGVTSGNSNRISKALAGVGRQGDLGSVLGIGLGNDFRCLGLADIPLYRADIGRRATHINAGAQRHARSGSLDGGGHAGDGGLGDGIGCTCLRCTGCSYMIIRIFIRNDQICYRKVSRSTCSAFNCKLCSYQI